MKLKEQMFYPNPGGDEGRITKKTMIDYMFHKFRERMVDQLGVTAIDVLGREDSYTAFVSAANDSLAVVANHLKLHA